MLRGNMHMLATRQKLIAENIANANTPGFTPSDIDEKGFQKALRSAMGSRGGQGIAMKHVDPRHFQSPGVTSASTGTPQIRKAPNSETTINGNSVVLEEQVAALADTRMRYNTAIGLYQKSLSLVRLALKAPGT